MIAALFDKAYLVQLHRQRKSGFPKTLSLFAILLAAEALLFLVLFNGWSWWWAVPLVAFLSHLWHCNLISFHEAAHGNLHEQRWLNEAHGILLGWYGWSSLNLFRAMHNTHHHYFCSERDEELWPFVKPTTPRWVRRSVAAIELTFGPLFQHLQMMRCFLRRGSIIQDPKTRRLIWVELTLIMALIAFLFGGAAWLGAWKYLFVMLLLPGVLGSNLHSWRKYIEHMGLTGSTVLGLTRNVVAPGFCGRLLASSMSQEPLHGVHHTYPGLCEAIVPQAVGVLAPTQPDELAPFPTYRHAFGHMVRTLGDPRVGSQWNRSSVSESSNRAAPSEPAYSSRMIEIDAGEAAETHGVLSGLRS